MSDIDIYQSTGVDKQQRLALTSESLFNVLTHLDVIPNARVLDLFAGTGALGLEALSRGAAHVTFVDDGRIADGLIRKNINLTQSSEHTTQLRTR